MYEYYAHVAMSLSRIDVASAHLSPADCGEEPELASQLPAHRKHSSLCGYII